MQVGGETQGKARASMVGAFTFYSQERSFPVSALRVPLLRHTICSNRY